jgi:cbb3-type cytochrome oxidase subunit 3
MEGYQLLRSVMTILEVLAFGVIVWWACGSARRAIFDEAAQMPLHDDQSMATQSAVAPAKNRGIK